MKYITDTFTGKIYDETAIASINAVDPNHFDTDMQLCDQNILDLQKKITDEQAKKAQILANKVDFFTQHPTIVPAIPLP